MLPPGLFGENLEGKVVERYSVITLEKERKKVIFGF